MNSITDNRKGKFLTACCFLCVVLGQYGLFTTVLNLGDVVIIISVIYALFASIERRKITICTSLLPFFLYIVLHFVITLLLRDVEDMYDFLGTTFRYLMYLVLIVFCTRPYFDVEFGLRVYKFICVFSTAFIILQTFCILVFGFYPKGVLQLSFFPLRREDLSTYGDVIPVAQFYRFRPRSIFSEPAHYGTYVAGYLAISLFHEKKGSLPLQIFFTAGLLVSMSSTAILMCGAIWSMYFLKKSREGVKRTKFIVITVMIVAVIILVLRSSFFKFFMYRLTETSSTEDRFKSYSLMDYYFKGKPLFAAFGYGLGGIKEVIFSSGFPRLVISYGIVGSCCFALSCVLMFIRGSGYQRMLLIVFLALQLGTECLFGSFTLCFFPLVIAPSDSVSGSEPEAFLARGEYGYNSL